MTGSADLREKMSKADLAALIGTRADPNKAGPAPALPSEEASRVRLGASGDTPPDVLAALAVDPAVMVRVAVAMNTAAPAEADTRLARDTDERVRTLLARKVSAVIPHLPPEQREHLQAHALGVLQALVADEAVRVREAIADVVKEMPEAPRDLILRLARDGAFSVSEPVIRLSPLLSPEDLLAILTVAPAPVAGTPSAGVAVARRAGLSEAVSDMIAGGTDPAAITALLANHSASIREATLDSLIARAPSHTAWHEPLTRRPALSGTGARALSQIVATHLLRVLAERIDLDRDTTAELRLRLAERLQAHPPGREAAEPTPDAAMTEARSLAKAHVLNERKVLETVLRGDARRASAMLAVAAGVEFAVVERTGQLRNAKGIVSLVWRAGFTMRLAAGLQTLLAGLGPEASLKANASGGFPLAVDEMRWQVDCLMRGTR
jgi:uncharacterized protein (DUF2336 family)